MLALQFVEPENAAANQRAAKASNVHFLLEAVVCDMHSLALHVGTLASLLLACQRPGVKWNLRACRHLIHDDFKALTLALRYYEEIGIGHAAAVKITALCKELDAAQQRLAPLLHVPATTKLQRDQLQAHAAAWRKLSAEMIDALVLIEPVVRTRLNAIYLEDATTLSAFLRLASQGDASAVDDGGNVHPPKVKQRRRTPRLAINVPCKVHTAAGAAPGTIEDVSRYGLGLSTALPLELRQQVAVVLQDGRRLSAVVARARGTAIGLTLAEPLPDDDPLLAVAVA